VELRDPPTLTSGLDGSSNNINSNNNNSIIYFYELNQQLKEPITELTQTSKNGKE
jgi:hypothetical protein